MGEANVNDPVIVTTRAQLREILSQLLAEVLPQPAAPVAAPSPYLTTAEAASLLGLKKNTLEIWRSKGKGPDYITVGRAVRYCRESLIAYTKDSKSRGLNELGSGSMAYGRGTAPRSRRGNTSVHATPINSNSK